MRIGNWELPPGEEILQWRVLGGQPTPWVSRGQAGQMLEQLGYRYDSIGDALDISSRPGQRWQYDIGNHRVRYDMASGKYVITRWRDPQPHEPGWDPVPHLAALIDGLHDALATNGMNGCVSELIKLAAGPYAALRGGLLLDEPGREDISTEDAIREALREGGRARTSH